MARPKKIKWPIGFDDMLVYVMPKVRRERRIRFYRLFIRDYLHRPSAIKASEEEIDNAIAKDKTSSFDESTAFHTRMWIRMSMIDWKRGAWRARASNGGKARAKKIREEKEKAA